MHHAFLVYDSSVTKDCGIWGGNVMISCDFWALLEEEVVFFTLCSSFPLEESENDITALCDVTALSDVVCEYEKNNQKNKKITQETAGSTWSTCMLYFATLA